LGSFPQWLLQDQRNSWILKNATLPCSNIQ
jgi:hypothetical protein